MGGEGDALKGAATSCRAPNPRAMCKRMGGGWQASDFMPRAWTRHDGDGDVDVVSMKGRQRCAKGSGDIMSHPRGISEVATWEEGTTREEGATRDAWRRDEQEGDMRRNMSQRTKMKGKKRKNTQRGCSVAHAFVSGRVRHREKR